MEEEIKEEPKIYKELERRSKELGFKMGSDRYIGSLLKTLISSKEASNILELGTGVGLSLSWMIEGLDSKSNLNPIINLNGSPKSERIFF